MKKCAETDTLITVQHGTPSQRKAQREQERLRLFKIRNQDQNDTSE